MGRLTAMEAWHGPLAAFLAGRAGTAAAEVTALTRLGDGAIQETWSLDAVIGGVPHALVMRTDAPSKIGLSRPREQEFALLKAAHAAGVTVPEPLWLCTDESVIGKVFFIMRRVEGIAAGHRLVRDASLGGDRRRLLRRLGEELARIHSIRPPRPDLAFLGEPPERPALAGVARLRRSLDADPMPHPALEWGLRWLERHAPETPEVVLRHGDFRTGNYMVDSHGLTGILDWEFAGWSDPVEDIGWFCAKCWRAGAFALEAGGIGDRADLIGGYEGASGRRIEPDQVHYWEAMAHARWGVIALEQGRRHTSGGEESLELALTGHVVPELEYELLSLTREAA